MFILEFGPNFRTKVLVCVIDSGTEESCLCSSGGTLITGFMFLTKK